MFELPLPKTVIEPFKIKMVEPLFFHTPRERVGFLKEAFYNLFLLDAEAVTFDFLTDSGTSAMSAAQWAGLMNGDESYAGARSFRRFEKAVQELTGFQYVIPTHQGRSAEALFMAAMLKPGQKVIGNTHFDTTRANIESNGGIAEDLPDLSNQDFPGNIDLRTLEETLSREAKNVAAIIITITNNSVGGLPVSMANIKEARAISKKYQVPLYMDMARFAENAYFIKLREKGFETWSTEKIAQEIFTHADGALMSAKKDTFCNIGGFLAVQDEGLAQDVRSRMVITEGFPTYGGLTGRDMEALAIGLKEILDESYLAYRIRSVEYFGKGIEACGIDVVHPFGGHAVYLNAGTTLPQIPAHEYPGQSLSVALYQYMGIRSVEIGTVMLGRYNPETGKDILAPKELVRLALPRRVYTQSHIDYLIEYMGQLRPHLETLKGYRITYQPKHLRHFTAKFEPL